MGLFTELKRRNVIRVGIAYTVGAWLLAQIADLVLDVIGAPDIVLRSVVAVLALGLLPAVVFAWVFEMTPEGIKRESEVDRAQSTAHVTGRKLDRAIVAVLVIALAYFAYDKFVLDSQRDTALLEETNERNALERSSDGRTYLSGTA